MRRKWKRLDVAKLKDKNIGSGDEDEPKRPGYVDPCKIKWVYGPCNGREWPRLVISIYETELRDKDTFHLSCDRKDDPESWWDEAHIPIELGRDAISLMNEYMVAKERVAKECE